MTVSQQLKYHCMPVKRRQTRNASYSIQLIYYVLYYNIMVTLLVYSVAEVFLVQVLSST